MKRYRSKRIIADPLADTYAGFVEPMRRKFKLPPGVEAQVLELARLGLTVAEISQRLELGTRIVERILNSPTAAGALVLPALRPKTE